ncbi:heavy-metal-associated domain-containing protein [Arthrobacter crystallopoietes]|uniref:Copper chaperone CopZ n=1 Tax=Crystallibacter crystallopoietes TaxID=37928 RepID=A0A1H1DYI2_9MICC|nr:heavy-metal-associated domain-containing protein [Arthrobacter crystallopoietes]AUI50115.1 copper-transporting ATPase [Arthrobacter crystallopoietes]SDQ81507.1 Copper chaperone CopZ [Arthrobacter crystallopoietes]
MSLRFRRSQPDEGQLIRTTYQVAGMSCGHCETAVKTEIGSLASVTGVDVDLSSGAVTVASQRPLARNDVAAAVTEAGYTLI